jgi:hypothetical protein
MADSMADTMLRHATYIDRLASGIVNKSVEPAQIELADKIRKALADYEPDMPRREFNRIRRELSEITSTELRAMFAAVTEQLDELAINEANYLAEMIQDFADQGMQIPTEAAVSGATAAEMILESGTRPQVGTWSEFVRGNIDAQANLIDNTIRAGFSESQTRQQIVKRLAGTKRMNYADGLIMRNGKRWAETLVRTGISHYSNRAHDAVTEANSDVIEGEYFLCVFDSRTTLTCLHYGQLRKLYKPGDPTKPVLPLHYNERSQFIYKVKGLDPFTGRRSSNGAKPKTIDADTTPNEFLRNQPRWFVEEALGKQRAKLFLDGGLSVDKFTDMRGTPLTLDQLRALDSTDAAFRKAGL